MERFQISIQPEQHFDLFLSYEDQFSIKVDNLISLVYADGKPIGFILRTSTSGASLSIFAAVKNDQILLYASPAQAFMRQNLQAKDKMILEGVIAQCALYVIAAIAHNEQLSLTSYPSSLHMTVNTSPVAENVSFMDYMLANSVHTISNASAFSNMKIVLSASHLHNLISAMCDGSNLLLSDRANLTVNQELLAVPSSMHLKSQIAHASIYSLYYVSDWSSDVMEDLSDKSMQDMMFGEVIE